MTRANENQLKCALYKLYNETGDVHTLINECVRLGKLVERTKESEDEITLQNVFDEFNNNL